MSAPVGNLIGNLAATLTVALIGGLLLAGCGESAPETPRDPKTVRDAHERYQAAVAAGRGIEASKLVTSETLDYFSEIADLARTADADRLSERPLIDQMLVLTQRHWIDRDELSGLDGAGAFRRFVEAEARLHEEGARREMIGNIEIDGARASAIVIEVAGVSGARMQFAHQRGDWRLDLLPTLRAASDQIEKAHRATHPDLPIGEYLLMILSEGSGRTADASTWEPLSAGE